MRAPKTYEDLPYDELYDASMVVFALTSGERISDDDREHPLELAVFKGRLIGFHAEDKAEQQPIQPPITTEITVYRGWDSDTGDFADPLVEMYGVAALAIGKFEISTYNVKVVIRDEDDVLADRWLALLTNENSAGGGQAVIRLSGRCDQPADEAVGFIEDYAWATLGIEPEDFGDALDEGEHEPPVAHFEVAL